MLRKKVFLGICKVHSNEPYLGSKHFYDLLSPIPTIQFQKIVKYKPLYYIEYFYSILACLSCTQAPVHSALPSNMDPAEQCNITDCCF